MRGCHLKTALGVVILLLYDLSLCVLIENECEDIICSNFHEPVCGMAKTLDKNVVVKQFHNICHFKKIRCQLDSVGLELVPDSFCNIERQIVYNNVGRRIYDYSIVGAHQACNHTCPTYCTDAYDPACAQIWDSTMTTYRYRPIINHCHIDLYSCVFGVNVTIQPLIGKCYKNPSALNFMFNVASLKTLKLVDARRVSSNNAIITKQLDDFLDMIT